MSPSPVDVLAAITCAVAQNDSDSVISLVTELAFVCRTQKQPLDTVVDTVLEILDRTKAPGNSCGFQILLWIEGHFGELGDTGKSKLKQFVAKHYGQFSDTVAEEMADFVGGFRDEWGIGVVENWIANYETLTRDAAHSISTAIREFEDHPSHQHVDDPHRMRIHELAIRLREKSKGVAPAAG